MAAFRSALVRELAVGGFLANQRNAVLIGGTGTGKSHLAVAIARACIRDGARGRFFNVVDLVNRLEAEARAGRQGRLADQLARRDLVILDELGYLPFAQTGGQLLFHLVSRLYERSSIVWRTTARSSRPETTPGASIIGPKGNRSTCGPVAQVGPQEPPTRAVRRQPRGGRVGPRAGPSYGLPVRPPPCIPKGVNIARR